MSEKQEMVDIEKALREKVGWTALAIIMGLIGVVLGIVVSTSVKASTIAQESLTTSATTTNLVKNMNGALQFLVEKNGGTYDPSTGIIIIKDSREKKASFYKPQPVVQNGNEAVK